MKCRCAGPVGVPAGGARAAGRRGRRPGSGSSRDDRPEPEPAVAVGGEQSAQVLVRLDVGLLDVVEAVVVGLPDVDLRARQRLAVRGRDPAGDQARGPLPSAMSSPSSRRGDSTTWNGPSTVDSVAPTGCRLLMVSTSMETPSTSESRMNSCRLSSHMCPVRVRKSIGRLPFVLGRLDLADEPVQVPGEGLHHLPQTGAPRGGEAVHHGLRGGLLREVRSHGSPLHSSPSAVHSPRPLSQIVAADGGCTGEDRIHSLR